MTAAHVLWRRLDTPGHDACRLTASAGMSGNGSSPARPHSGTTVRPHTSSIVWPAMRSGAPERESSTDRLATSASGHAVQRTADGSSLDGVTVRGLDACVDLDLGFTPSTNALQLRRIALDVGQGADVPVAWLDVVAGTLSLLQQRYERRSHTAYWYEAPRFGYAAMLAVEMPPGFPRVYPDLWEAEP